MTRVPDDVTVAVSDTEFPTITEDDDNDRDVAVGAGVAGGGPVVLPPPLEQPVAAVAITNSRACGKIEDRQRPDISNPTFGCCAPSCLRIRTAL